MGLVGADRALLGRPAGTSAALLVVARALGDQQINGKTKGSLEGRVSFREFEVRSKVACPWFGHLLGKDSDSEVVHGGYRNSEHLQLLHARKAAVIRPLQATDDASHDRWIFQDHAVLVNRDERVEVKRLEGVHARRIYLASLRVLVDPEHWLLGSIRNAESNDALADQLLLCIWREMSHQFN